LGEEMMNRGNVKISRIVLGEEDWMNRGNVKISRIVLGEEDWMTRGNQNINVNISRMSMRMFLGKEIMISKKNLADISSNTTNRY
jgi:hypothetical protein